MIIIEFSKIFVGRTKLQKSEFWLLSRPETLRYKRLIDGESSWGRQESNV